MSDASQPSRHLPDIPGDRIMARARKPACEFSHIWRGGSAETRALDSNRTESPIGARQDRGARIGPAGAEEPEVMEGAAEARKFGSGSV